MPSYQIMTETKQNTRALRDGSIDLYFLAALEDEEVCLEIKKHLAPVIRSYEIPIKIYSDFDILPGQDVALYKSMLDQAEIVLAFISSDFTYNDEINDRLEAAIERYNKRETILLQILVRNCMWKVHPYENLQILPRNEHPLNNKQFWNSEDDALTAVAYEIYDAIKTYIVKKQEKPEKEVSPGISSFDEPQDVPDKVTGTPSKVYEVFIETPGENIVMKRHWRLDYFKRTFLKRGKAYLWDIMLTFIPVYALVLGLNWIFRGNTGCEAVVDVFDPGFWCHFIFYVAPTMALVGICAIFESSKKQATWGKMIMKMQTTDLNGNRLSLAKALWRNFLRFLIGGGLWVLLIPEFIRFVIGDTDEPKLGIILSLAFASLLIQSVYFFRTKKIIHDRLSATVVGEKIS